MSLSTSPLRQLRASFLALAATAIASLAIASSASAAVATGEVTLTLKKGAQSSLLRQGVKLDPSSGGGKAKTVKLAVTDLDLASGAVRTGATLTFRANGESVKLNDLLVSVGATSTAVTGRHGGRKKVVFRLKGSSQASASSLGVSGPLALTGTGLKLLRQGLELPSLKGGKVGSAAASAAIPPAPEPPKPDEPKKVDPYPYASQCPVAAVEGSGGFANPPGKVGGVAALPTFSPGTSQELSGEAVEWGLRTSFRSYALNAPPPGTLQTLDGASASAPGAGMSAPGQFFSFPNAGGDYEPGDEADHSDDKLVAESTGTVLFCKSGHGFNVVLRNPTVVIDGESSRNTAEVGANMNGTWYPFQKADIAELDISDKEPVISDSGNTIAWEGVPAKLTADGASAMGVYKAGESIDPVTVKASLERPMLAECAIASGDVAPTTAVAFNNAALPTLTSPFVVKGPDVGVINWGFRPSLRASVAGSGSFQLLGGATKAFENMGGEAAVNAPTGRVGKYFSFPVDRYEWEVGTADPKDDRLVAYSNATVGICNPAAGNYGIAISKPTLVIDGANSRLVANSYSWQGAKGWLGGRVDVVELNTTPIEAVTEGAFARWGEIPAADAPLLNGIQAEGGLLTGAFSLANLFAGTGSGGFDPVSARIALP